MESVTDAYEARLAAASVDVDLFVARQSKVIEIPVESQEDTDDLIEMIAEKKAAGEIATDQEFRIMSTTDTVRSFTVSGRVSVCAGGCAHKKGRGGGERERERIIISATCLDAGR